MEVGGAVVDGEDALGSEQAGGVVHRRGRHRAQDVRDPREDYVEVLVLAHQGVRAGDESAEAPRAVVVGGREQYAWRLPEGLVEADPPDDGGPVHSRHVPVDQDGLREVVRVDVEHLDDARGAEHRVAGPLEGAPELLAERGAIVDEKDARPFDRAVTALAHELARARQDVVDVVGLADVVVRSDLQGTDPVLHVGFRREHEHRDLGGPCAANFAQEIDAVGVGQEDVEHHQRCPLPRERSPRLLPRRAGDRAEARGAKRILPRSMRTVRLSSTMTTASFMARTRPSRRRRPRR